MIQSRDLGSLYKVDTDASVNLIQKAHEMYNQKYPQKVVSLVSKPPKIPAHDLPTIDEAEQKEEQNTFAQGMPLGALLNRNKEYEPGSYAVKARDGIRSAGL